jgi:hypothetical protein
MMAVDRELRDWLRSLAETAEDPSRERPPHQFSEEDAAYLERIATDGSLAAALAEISAAEPELAG